MANLLSVARHFCDASDWQMTNLGLQKLVYLAHMYHSGRTGSELVNEEFEAWDYGPVVPQLYHKVKAFGSNPIRDIFPEIPLRAQDRSSVDKIWLELRDKTPGQLVAITHDPRYAWYKNYRPKLNNVIPQEDILDEYRKRAEKR